MNNLYVVYSFTHKPSFWWTYHMLIFSWISTAVYFSGRLHWQQLLLKEQRFYTSWTILFVREEKAKKNKLLLPLCYQQVSIQKHVHGMNSYRHWCSLVPLQHRHCLDERCVLMRTVWEFNEARMNEPEATGVYWSEMFLGDSSFFFFMCWISFRGLCNGSSLHVLYRYDLCCKRIALL